MALVEFIRRHRFSITLLLSGLFIGLGLAFRPSSVVSGYPETHYWMRKAVDPERYSVVLLGDSRVYRGLSPEEIERRLPGRRVLNFGFSAAGLSGDYLDAAEARLSTEEPRLLILGVTPYALTPTAAKNLHYKEALKKGLEQGFELPFAPFLHLFRPYDLNDLVRSFKGETGGYYQTYHPDGWVASRQIPENPRSALGPYRKQFERNQVSEKILARLAEKVAEWRGKGIRVWAFRPPSTPAMEELEEALSGYDPAKVRATLEGAGARWLSFESTYPSYDGSHLREDGARRFSADLAEKVASDLGSP